MVPVFVINLKDANSRWDNCTKSAKLHGIELHRIDGVDVRKSNEPWRNVSKFWFSICHGRRILPGEYGCYQSHLKALEKIISLDLKCAIICEDDVVFNSEFAPDTEEIFNLRPDLDVLKMMNHRCHGFKKMAQTKSDKEVGYTLWGPLGSAATYAVSAKGAKKLREGLKTMMLPFDNALERGWANGCEVQCVSENWLAFSSENQVSQIATNYAASKYPFFMRLPTLIFRIKEILLRLFYVMKLSNKYR